MGLAGHTVTDPRALLDAYEYDNAANDDHAPKAFAALRAVLDLHKPRDLNVRASRVGGTCPRCLELGKPLRITLSGGPGLETHEIHEHPDPEPKCFECVDANSYDEPVAAPWPCRTVQEMAAALTCGDTL